MSDTLRYILGIFLILAALGGFLSHDYLAATMTMLTGITTLPVLYEKVPFLDKNNLALWIPLMFLCLMVWVIV